MINPQDAPALTPAERMLVQSWTEEERQHVHRVLGGDIDVRQAITYINTRRDILRASEQAMREKNGE